MIVDIIVRVEEYFWTVNTDTMIITADIEIINRIYVTNYGVSNAILSHDTRIGGSCFTIVARRC